MKIKEKGELNYLFEGVDIYDLQEDQPTDKIQFKGSNNHNTAVLYRSENDGELQGDDLHFLEKILGAVKLKFEDVALINIHPNKTYHFSELKHQIDFNTMIAFGVLPDEVALNINYKKNWAVTLLDTKILFSDSLKDLMQDPKKKGLLWKGLKELFDIEQHV